MSRPPGAPSGDLQLRPVEDADISTFYQHQLDPLSTAMAAFPTRAWDDHAAHWDRARADPTVTARAIVANSAVVGHIVSFEMNGLRQVGYWLGREHWGRGIATRALNAFLAVEPARPLHAHVVQHNTGSIRVLQKCGFTISSRHTGPDGLVELLLTLSG